MDVMNESFHIVGLLLGRVSSLLVLAIHGLLGLHLLSHGLPITWPFIEICDVGS